MLERFARILVVDDNATIRTIVRRMFCSLGYNDFDEAADGAAAMALLCHRRYDLIISDWFMEPMSGLELLTKVRQTERCATIWTPDWRQR